MEKRGHYAVAALMALMASASAALAADKLDADDKKWLAQVSALIEPDEQRIYKTIPKAERPELQAIFWARRNPQGPSAPTNEFKERFLRAAQEADKKFTLLGTPGAATGCGRVYLLLGPPDSVGPTATDRMAEMGRPPEAWTYRDRPGVTFPGGRGTIAFDGRCEPRDDGALNRDLAQLAADRIVAPDIKPEVGPDGHLVSLVELLKRRRTPAQMLFINPRQDLQVESERKLAMRVALGRQVGTYVAGLLRVPAAGLTSIEEGGKKKLALVIATQLVGADRQVVNEMDGERAAVAGADGRIAVSYSVAAAPGPYTLRIAVADPASDRGAVTEMPFPLPSYTAAGLQLSEPLVLAGVEPVGPKDAQDPLADFVMGDVRLVPRFGNVFRKSESVQFLCMGYNAALDPSTHKPSAKARFEVLKDGKPLTASNEIAIDTVDFAPSLGPIPLAGVEPGMYQLRVVVADRVANKELTATTAYQVVP